MAGAAFGICYDPGKEPGLFRCFEVLVLEFTYPAANVATLVGQGKTVFGYVSLGKVDEGRSWFPRLRDVGALESFEAGTDPLVWKIDVAHPEWERLLLEQVLPELRSNGFVGAFLDDLDDIFERNEHPDAVRLIQRIHEAFPDLLLMGNRGLQFLTDFCASVQYSLLESCVAENFKIRPEGDLEFCLAHLRAAQRINPELVGCAADYYAPCEEPITPELGQLIAEIRRRHSEHHLLSCVTTKQLQQVPLCPPIPEDKEKAVGYSHAQQSIRTAGRIDSDPGL